MHIIFVLFLNNSEYSSSKSWCFFLFLKYLVTSKLVPPPPNEKPFSIESFWQPQCAALPLKLTCKSCIQLVKDHTDVDVFGVLDTHGMQLANIWGIWRLISSSVINYVKGHFLNNFFNELYFLVRVNFIQVTIWLRWVNIYILLYTI